MHPLRPRLSRKTTVCIVVCIWAVSSGVAAPNFIFYTTAVVPVAGGGYRILCYGQWPDGQQTESQLEYIHSIVIMVLTYILPMLSMGFTYTRMGVMLWGSKGVGEPTPNHMDAIKSKRKVVKMMIVVVTIFGVCWLPFHMYFILYTQIPEINDYPYIQEIYLALYWLAMSNSMYNPMIYCWLNSRFRNGFRRVLSLWCPCIPSVGDTSNRRQSHVTNSNFTSIGSPDAVNRIQCDDPVTLRSYFKVPEKHHPSLLSTSSTTLRSNVSSRSNTATRSQQGQDQPVNGQGNNTKLSSNGLQTLKVEPSSPRCTTPV